MVTQNAGDIEIRLRGDNRQLRQVLDQSQSRIGRFTRSVRSNLGGIATGAGVAGAAIGALAFDATRAFQETDRSLRNLQNQLRRTETRFDGIAHQINIVRRVSTELGVPVNRLADGFARVDVSGFDTAHIEEFTTHVGRLFQITQAETSQLGQLVSQVDRFNGAARGLTESAAVVSLLSAEQIEDIAEGQTLFRANLAGLSPERTLSVYDALTGAGINQTDAQSLLDNLVEGASGLGLQGTNITTRELAEFTNELGGLSDEDLRVFQRLDQDIQSNRAEFESTTQAVNDYNEAFDRLNLNVDRFLQSTRAARERGGQEIVEAVEGNWIDGILRWVAENPLLSLGIGSAVTGGIGAGLGRFGGSIGRFALDRIVPSRRAARADADIDRRSDRDLRNARRASDAQEAQRQRVARGNQSFYQRYPDVDRQIIRGNRLDLLTPEQRADLERFRNPTGLQRITSNRYVQGAGRFLGRFRGGGSASGAPIELYFQQIVQDEIEQGIRDAEGRPVPRHLQPNGGARTLFGFEVIPPAVADDGVRSNRRLSLSYRGLGRAIEQTEPALDSLRNSFYENATTSTRILDEEFEKDKALLDGLSNSVHDTVNVIGIDWDRLFPDTPAENLDSAFGSVDSSLRSAGENIGSTFDTTIKPEVDRISDAWSGLNWRDAWDETDTAVSTTWGDMSRNYKRDIEPIVVTSGLSNLSVDWGTAWTGVKDKAAGVWATIGTLYDEHLADIFASGEEGDDSGFRGGLNWLSTNWGIIWDGVSSKATGVWGSIENLYNEHLKPLFDPSEDTDSPFVGGLRWTNEKWDGIWSGVKSRAETAWAGIARLYETHLAPLFNPERETDSLFVKGVRWVRDKWDGIWGGVESDSDTRWRGISELYDKWLAPLFRGGNESPPQTSDSRFMRGLKWLRDKWGELWGSIAGGAETEWSSIHRHHEQYLDPLFDGAGETPPSDTDSPFVRGLKWIRDKWDGIWKDAYKSLQASDGGGGISPIILSIGREIQKWRDRLDSAITKLKEFLRLIGVLETTPPDLTQIPGASSNRSQPNVTIQANTIYGLPDLNDMIVAGVKEAQEQGRLRMV